MSFFESKAAFVSILIVFFVCAFWSPFFSFSREGIIDALIGTPKYWFDEGFVVEAARGLVSLGRLDIAVEPGVLSGKPYFASSPGFPVAVPLAGIFVLFGDGVLQIRTLAFVWLLAALTGIYLLWRRMFGPHAAFWGALLLATFAPFYANGKTITGEIPGFLFLILALYSIYYKKWYVWGGVFAALALATKPSIYLLIAPALILEFVIFERPFWRHALRVAIGTAPVLLLWLFIMFQNPFSSADWRGALRIYTNHYPLPSLLSQLPGTGVSFFGQSTILYTLVLAALFASALLWKRLMFTEHEQRVFWFIAFYGIIDVIYFLLSPGWLRYLLPSQLFLLLALYPALHALGSHPRRIAPGPVILLLVLLQGVVFLWFSDIKSGLDAPHLAAYINQRLGENTNATVGIINAVQVSSLIPAEKKFLVVNCGGGCRFGTHPLSVAPERLPTYLIVGKSDRVELSAFTDVVREYYREVPEEQFGALIYTRQ